MNKKIFENMSKNEKLLSKYACKSSEAVRFKKIEEDIRTSYFRDSDKILYSLAYTRYIDKTQVYSNSNNDMISKRMTHVQLVSKIARTIGRALNLNEDLIEAASLGHDLGHVPFGHVGEKILNQISIENGQGYFYHNVQSVRDLMELENNGKGLNITVQVLDAIFCHNGESLSQKYYKTNKTPDKFLDEYKKSYNDSKILKEINPMTLEGCVVKISDIISYVGHDIEDAIRIGKLNREDIPEEIVNVLGNNNSEIINEIITDIIENSFDKDYICMSTRIYQILNKLIKFNYENIYFKANNKEDIQNISYKFHFLFNKYMNQLKCKELKEDIYINFLDEMCEEYMNNTTNERKVIDYISGMTDDYFLNQYKKYNK